MRGQHSEKRDILCNHCLVGITVLLSQHTAYKTSSTNPERSSWNNPKLEKGQFAKPLVSHEWGDVLSIVPRLAAAAMNALLDGLQEPVISAIWGYLLGIAIPELVTWQDPAESASKAIDQIEWMHFWFLVGCGVDSGERVTLKAVT